MLMCLVPLGMKLKVIIIPLGLNALKVKMVQNILYFLELHIALLEFAWSGVKVRVLAKKTSKR